jgi:hypothetical protein
MKLSAPTEALPTKVESGMKWEWLVGAALALAYAYYSESLSGLERLALIALALCALWIFDWRR